MDIWLHVGASKTGTSAIQVALARLRPQLAAAGLWYPEAMSSRAEQSAQAGEITSGNAEELGRMVNPSLRPSASVDRLATVAWVRQALAEAGQRTVLFSSETLQGPDPAEGRALAALLTEGGQRRLHILYYVRNALDHCVAALLQWFKVGQARPEERDFDAQVSHSTMPFLSQLETWASIVGKEAVTCRLYDEDRSALVTRLLETVHPRAAAAVGRWTFEESTSTMNRSPTTSEFSLLQRLNLEPDAAALCRWLCEGVLNAPPAIPEALRISEAAFSSFEARNASQVETLNTDWLLPTGRKPLVLTSGQIEIGRRKTVAMEEAYASCFIGAARRMEREKQALLAEVRLLQESVITINNNSRGRNVRKRQLTRASRWSP